MSRAGGCCWGDLWDSGSFSLSLSPCVALDVWLCPYAVQRKQEGCCVPADSLRPSRKGGRSLAGRDMPASSPLEELLKVSPSACCLPPPGLKPSRVTLRAGEGEMNMEGRGQDGNMEGAGGHVAALSPAEQG